MLSKPKILLNQEMQQAPTMSNITDVDPTTDASSFTDVPTIADVAPSKRSQVLSLLTLSFVLLVSLVTLWRFLCSLVAGS